MYIPMQFLPECRRVGRGGRKSGASGEGSALGKTFTLCSEETSNFSHTR